MLAQSKLSIAKRIHQLLISNKSNDEIAHYIFDPDTDSGTDGDTDDEDITSNWYFKRTPRSVTRNRYYHYNTIDGGHRRCMICSGLVNIFIREAAIHRRNSLRLHLSKYSLYKYTSPVSEAKYFSKYLYTLPIQSYRNHLIRKFNIIYELTYIIKPVNSRSTNPEELVRKLYIRIPRKYESEIDAIYSTDDERSKYPIMKPHKGYRYKCEECNEYIDYETDHSCLIVPKCKECNKLIYRAFDHTYICSKASKCPNCYTRIDIPGFISHDLSCIFSVNNDYNNKMMNSDYDGVL